MTAKGYAVAEHLLRCYPDLLAYVVTSADPGVQHDYVKEITALCATYNVPCYDRRQAPPLTTPFVLAISWRWLLHPQGRLIVCHDSLLPTYRGFNPLVTGLINGDPEIGVTALYAAVAYDGGPIIAQSASRVQYPIKIADAIELVSRDYVRVVDEVARQLSAGQTPLAVEQDDAAATYSLWRDEDDYQLDWSLDAVRLRRTIDALGYPYKGAASYIADRKVRIFEAEEVPDLPIGNRAPGKVIFMVEGIPTIVCGHGLLRLLDVRDDETGESVLPMKNFRVRLR
mgnify:CR=1 FL=1